MRAYYLPPAPGGKAKPGGMEGTGEVAKLGAGVTRFKVGDRVMGRCPGAFAEYGLMDARETLPVPQRLSWEEAAAVPIAFLVVYDMLLAQGRLKAGEWLLVTGATSGVGAYALQAAKALGAGVIGTSGSADKLATLKPLDLDAVHAKRLTIFGVSNKLCNAEQRGTTVRGFEASLENGVWKMGSVPIFSPRLSSPHAPLWPRCRTRA